MAAKTSIQEFERMQRDQRDQRHGELLSAIRGIKMPEAERLKPLLEKIVGSIESIEMPKTDVNVDMSGVEKALNGVSREMAEVKALLSRKRTFTISRDAEGLITGVVAE